MINRNKMLLGGLGLLGFSTFVLGVSPTYAYWRDASKTGPNYTPERHAQMEKAFETNDYNTWKNLMSGKGWVTEVVNNGNFSRFAQMHKLVEEGKTEEAQAIRKELGLGEGKGMGRGPGVGKKYGQGNWRCNWQVNQNR